MSAHSPSTNVVIFTTAALYREAWRALLCGRPDLVVVGAAGTVDEVAALRVPGRVTTVLVDLHGPQPELVCRLATAASGCGLLFLVSSYEPEEIVALLRAGATGCLSRDEPVSRLVRGIVAAGRGELVLPPAVAARALSRFARGGRDSTHAVETLSDRERDVLRLLARGLTNKDIAQALLVSVRTVETHLYHLYPKLGIRSRTEAVLWAVRNGYAADSPAFSPTTIPVIPLRRGTG